MQRKSTNQEGIRHTQTRQARLWKKRFCLSVLFSASPQVESKGGQVGEGGRRGKGIEEMFAAVNGTGSEVCRARQHMLPEPEGHSPRPMKEWIGRQRQPHTVTEMRWRRKREKNMQGDVAQSQPCPASAKTKQQEMKAETTTMLWKVWVGRDRCVQPK